MWRGWHSQIFAVFVSFGFGKTFLLNFTVEPFHTCRLACRCQGRDCAKGGACMAAWHGVCFVFEYIQKVFTGVCEPRSVCWLASSWIQQSVRDVRACVSCCGFLQITYYMSSTGFFEVWEFAMGTVSCKPANLGFFAGTKDGGLDPSIWQGRWRTDIYIYRFVLAKKWQDIQSYNELYRLCYISIAVKIAWMTYDGYFGGTSN